LVQSSFLAHFRFLGLHLNLVLIAVALINLFLKDEEMGFISAFIGGFYLDLFSAGKMFFFGFYTLVSLLLALFIKFILSHHVKIPFARKI
jgi:hypothetical protein